MFCLHIVVYLLLLFVLRCCWWNVVGFGLVGACLGFVVLKKYCVVAFVWCAY
jgi:hypothetical protein